MQKQMKRKLLTVALGGLVTLIAMLVECDVYFPDKMQLFCGEQLYVREGSPYTVDASAVLNSDVTGSFEAEVKLFGLIPVKNMEVEVLSEEKVIPGGKTVGIKLFTKGLMCVGTEKLTGEDGAVVDAEAQADLRMADVILKANGETLHTVEQFSKKVEQSAGSPVILTVMRGGDTWETALSPVKTEDGYKLGIWVRDSTAGIGTVTFLHPGTRVYGALGHPITDVDTGAIMPVEQGSITNTEIVNVKKGKRGEPGELRGMFDQSGTEQGVIFRNTSRGIYGVAEKSFEAGAEPEAVPLASKSQVRTGNAQIYANVDGKTVEAFDVEIVKIMKHSPDDKNMVVKVKDPRLLERTGGIVQGMSGSPILQNGKIVGAVTHVFVNDPTRGYGIFIENMLAEAEKIE